MVPVFWLALLFGYLVGAGGAVLFLPSELIEPLYGGLAVATVVVAAITALMLMRHRRRQGDRSTAAAASPPTEPTPPGGGHAKASRSGAPTSVAAASAPRTRPIAGSGATPRAGSAKPWPVPTSVAPAATLGVDELRQALFEGRVRIEMRRLTSLPARRGRFHHARARLCDLHGRPFPARRYRPTLTRCGLLGVFDRLVVVHARQALARAVAAHPEAQGAGGLRLVCAIDASSLEEPNLMAELEQLAADDRPLLPQIVLELDRRRLDGPTRQRIERLRQLGIRFCLHRLVPDCRAAIGRGFDFIKIEMAPARLKAVDAERDLAIATLTAAGLTVLVDGGDPAGLVEIGRLPWSYETARQSAA